MAINGFNVVVPGTGVVWEVDQSGNSAQLGTISAAASSLTTSTVSAQSVATLTTTGVTVETVNSGVNSSLAANYLNATIGAGAAAILGTAASGTQLSDLTRDYMVYLQITAGGAGATLTIGTANTCNSTLFVNATTGPGTMYSFRLPAAWFIRMQATAAFTQTAISC
jgi:hypothetical protein